MHLVRRCLIGPGNIRAGKWVELDNLSAGDQWTIPNAPERLAVGNKPWAKDGKSAKCLTKAVNKLGLKPD